MLDTRQYLSIERLHQIMAISGNWSLSISKHWLLFIWWAVIAMDIPSSQERKA